jgi:beta-lactamase regulating signal transducer with metallopeptidase domain
MSPLFETIALWLADVHLLGGALLAVVLPTLLLLRQPAQRMAVAKSALAALAALVVLCALPGWSLVHLLSAEAPVMPMALPMTTPVLAPQPQSVNQFIPHINIDQIPNDLPSTFATSIPAPAEPVRPSLSWPAALVLLQGIGSAAVIAWLAVGAIMVRRVRRTSQPASPELQRLLAELSRATSPPSLLVSTRVATPVALGLRRPAILLPANLVPPGGTPKSSQGVIEVENGSPNHHALRQTLGVPHEAVAAPTSLLAILAHEYAHVAAGDLRTLALARLLLAIFWPQPLFWLLRRRIRFDQESLADAAAAEVAGRVNYAEQLVGWARTAPPRVPRLAGAIGLWEGPSQLKRRITLLLDEQLTILRHASRRWRIGTACAALVAAALLSLVTVQRQEVVAADSTSDAAPPPVEATATAPPAAEAAPATLPITVRGRAVTNDNKPLAGATIYLASLRGDWKRLAETTSNADGAYEFHDVALPIEPPLDKGGRASGGFEVFGLADGHAFAYRPLKWVYPNTRHYDDSRFHYSSREVDRPHGYGTDDPIVLDLTFAKPQRLVGRLIDDTGQPIAGAALAIRYMSPIPADGYASEKQFRISSPADECESFNEHAIVPPSFKTQQTDADGKFEFRRLPENVRFWMAIDAPGFPGRAVWAATRAHIKKYDGGPPVHVGEMTLTLRRPQDVIVKVVYDDTGEPAPKVLVMADGREANDSQTSDVLGLAHLRMPTGKFRLSLAPQWRTPYLETEGELVVGEDGDAPPSTIRLRRAAEVKFVVKDAKTRAPLADIGLWYYATNDPRGANAYRKRVGYYSGFEEATRISHYDEPTTDASGAGIAHFEPGDYVIGLAPETFPAGYKAVQGEGKQVTCVAGLTENLTLEMQSTVSAADAADAAPTPPADDQRAGAAGILRTLEPLHGMGAGQTAVVQFVKPDDGVNAQNAAGQRLLVRQVGGEPFLMPSGGAIDPNASSPGGQRSVLDALSPASDAFRTNNPDVSAWFLVAAPAPDAGSDAAETTPNGGSSISGGATAAAAARPAEIPDWARHEPNVVKGRAVDPAGQPLVGVEVTLYRVVGWDGAVPEQLAVQTTGPDGNFKFENVFDVAKEFPQGLPDDRFVSSPIKILMVVGRAPGRATKWSNGAAYRVVREGYGVQLVMDRAAALTGRVTARDGRPIANAVVRFFQVLLPAGDSVNVTRTDADGRYAITDLAPYDAEATKRMREEQAKQDPNLASWTMVNVGMNVQVEHPDFATSSATIPRVPGTVDLELAPGSAIEGVVVIGDRTGVPLPAANVSVTLMRQTEPRITLAQLGFQPARTASVQTDGAGRYRFGSLAAGSYVMNAQSEGFVCHGVRDMKVGEGETTTAPEMTLTRGGTVRFKLVDANTNKPLALPDGTRGYVIPHPRPPLPSPRVVTFRNAVAETQMLAGRYGFIVNIPGATPTDPSWQSDKLPTTTLPEIKHDVKEGETVEVEVPVKLQDMERAATGTLQLYAPAAPSSGEDDEAAQEPKAPAAAATTPAANQGSSTGGVLDKLDPTRGAGRAEVILVPLEKWGYGLDGGSDNAPRR